ncbi:hypothetical protein GCM10020256_08710 [Streptomyces thermocoprophilus]
MGRVPAALVGVAVAAFRGGRLVRLCHGWFLLVLVAVPAAAGGRRGGYGQVGADAGQRKPVDMYWSTLVLSTTAE